MSVIGKLQDDNIPLADDDPQVIIHDDQDIHSNISNGQSLESIPGAFANESPTRHDDDNDDNDVSPDEQEEKARLISQVLELQNTLDDLAQRVDSVKEENIKLRSENQVLGQYIENLMSASSVFQSTPPNQKKK